MSKKKPRLNPEKPQNNYGGDGDCPNLDTLHGGNEFCHDERNAIYWKPAPCKSLPCRGNLHECGKLRLKYLASLSEKKKTKVLEANPMAPIHELLTGVTKKK
jgi:hypothetical protein